MLSGAKTNESGRSMVEMLGVLAIIGVLSVGGIAGYSKAMAKFKLTKAQDQITMTLMNVRTAYASSPTYEGMTSKLVGDYNLASSDMIVKDQDGSVTGLIGAFGGTVQVASCGGGECNCTLSEGSTADGYFCISMAGLTQDACVSLATSDWGADGLVGMTVGDGNQTSSTDLPMSMATAVTQCETDDTTSITWVYY